ncbi:hypothetical protein EMCG_06274 [[Emmonsia] crescens]|uniref:Glucose 1-dehydrogenase n=1 Tax=[Emmonsia] crescens TaxID=73230 RepID=A0A0G2IBM7_9EURO|nr:hypothetical protein EMCG_06274 [Emmonsia crescens UAMH 3008]
MAAPIGSRLQDKVAIITGSASGIGRGIALLYASQGAYVVCSDIDPTPNLNDSKPTHDVINETYPAPAGVKGTSRAVFIKADVSVSNEVENLVKECVKVFGRLDIMVNNAGISPIDIQGPDERTHETSEISWDNIMGVNGKGVWLGCKFATGQMLSQEPHASGDRGWIINMASVLGTVAAPGTATYTASKHAVIGITKSVALEYGKDRIHVNAIAPGFIQTSMTATLAANSNDYALMIAQHPFDSRLGRPDDIAGAALFLASDDAKWVTAITLQVDGGYVAQ